MTAPTPVTGVDAAIAALKNRGDLVDLQVRATVLDAAVREPRDGNAVNARPITAPDRGDRHTRAAPDYA